MYNKYGPILSVEQKAIVGNVILASNRDYNHGAIIRICMEWGAVAPKRTWGPLFLFPNLGSYNINNQLIKFEKNLRVGSDPNTFLVNRHATHLVHASLVVSVFPTVMNNPSIAVNILEKVATCEKERVVLFTLPFDN